MLEKTRTWLQEKLRAGFWFPVFQAIIKWLYTKLSLGYRFKKWLDQGSYSPPGASELYQFVLVLVAALWLAFVHFSPLEMLHGRIAQVGGALVAMYFVTELFLFTLQWTFVDTGPLHSVKRSLAGFLLNLPEIALFFSIAFYLLSCTAPPSRFELLKENFGAVITLQLPATGGSCACRWLAYYQRVVSATLVVIVIASLVGAVVRKDRGDSENGAGAV